MSGTRTTTKRWWVAAGMVLAGGAPAWACDVPVAQVASVQGTVELRRGEGPWQRLEPAATVCPGDIVRVGERSRAALLMRNQTTLRLDQSTQLTLLPTEEAGATVIQQLKGIVNVITRTPRPFRLGTPFVNANVEGTEFMVLVGERDSTVRVVEGRVVASNPVGRVVLGAGEQASGPADVLPLKAPALRPTDAVQWALHYPLLRPASGAGTPDAREAAALRDAGRFDAAIARLDAVPETARDGGWRVQRAALLLEVGRADEAAPLLAGVAAGDPARAEALALQAIIALARNEAPAAQVRAEEAVAADPRSVVARIAASYVRQSRFDLDGARLQAREAQALDPSNALAGARLAELALYAGDIAGARAEAERAAQQGPSIGRVQAVLGFAYLAARETAAARDAFERARLADQGDPLPHLGMGLALIREGRLPAGREEIEIAVSLDPENAALRSALGKAYAAEHRGKQAFTQYELAKQRDPLDPTPWFYGALDRLVAGRPVEALADAERSIALNDNRAVYRSRLLLDDDLAVRGAGLARIYGALGFDRLGQSEAAKSLAVSPDTPAAHRFLADAYGAQERHELASVSELMQAVLLQPVEAAHVAPSRSWAPVLGLIDPAVLGIPEDAAQAFAARGVSGRLGLALGSRGLWSGEASASYVADRFGLSAGSFRYHSDGFRTNSDTTHRVDHVLLQYALLPSLSLQAEWRQRESELGDVGQRFDEDDLRAQQRYVAKERALRGSVVWRPAPAHTVVLSHLRQERDESALLSRFPVEASVIGDYPGEATELQYRWQGTRGSLQLGGGRGTAAIEGKTFVADRLGGVFPPCPGTRPCISVVPDHVKESRVYAYGLVRASRSVVATLGFAHDRRESGGDVVERWSPKLGVMWTPNASVTLRAASFGAMKRQLGIDRSVEPTQVAGFNQLVDDGNGVYARTNGIAFDWSPASAWRFVFEHRERRLDQPPGVYALDPTLKITERWRERDSALLAFWTPAPHVAVRAGLTRDAFSHVHKGMDDAPLRLRTMTAPVALKYFWSTGSFVEVVVTTVRQRVDRAPQASAAGGSERFALVDFGYGFRLPALGASMTLTAKNVFGQRFRFQDDAFRYNELRQSRWLPVRSVVLAGQWSF